MYNKEIADKVLGEFLNTTQSEQIRFKRLSGLRVDDMKIGDRIHFFALFPEEVPRSMYINDVILTGLSVAAFQERNVEGAKLYEALADAYYATKSSDSLKRDIECFVQARAEYNMTFIHDFWKIYHRIQKEQNIDVFGMIHDLIAWDDKKTKTKYVNALVFYEKNKKTAGEAAENDKEKKHE